MTNENMSASKVKKSPVKAKVISVADFFGSSSVQRTERKAVSASKRKVSIQLFNIVNKICFETLINQVILVKQDYCGQFVLLSDIFLNFSFIICISGTYNILIMNHFSWISIMIN